MKEEIVKQMFHKLGGVIYPTAVFVVCDYFEQYAIEKQIELLDDLRCKWFIDDSDKKDLYQRINTLQQQLQKLKDGK